MQPVFGRGLWQDFLKCRFLFLCNKHPKFKCVFSALRSKTFVAISCFSNGMKSSAVCLFSKDWNPPESQSTTLLNSSFKIRNYFQLKWYKPKTNQIQHIPMVRYDLVGIAGFVCALNAHTTDLNIWNSATLSLPLSLCVLAIPETRF